MRHGYMLCRATPATQRALQNIHAADHPANRYQRGDAGKERPQQVNNADTAERQRTPSLSVADAHQHTVEMA